MICHSSAVYYYIAYFAIDAAKH